ncbi:MAG: hypothetical protein Aurels2KO_19060 [Aureliella sp.]
MDEQGYRFGVGVLVVASMVVAVILILFFGAAPNLLKEQYVVTIRFSSAPGVATDTPVRKSGVRIGRVKAIKLLRDAGLGDSGVDLTLELDSQYKVYAGEQPQIGIGSLITNDAVVEFRPPSDQSLLTRFDGSAGSPTDGVLDENERNASEAVLQDGDFLSGGTLAPDPLAAIGDMQGSMSSALNSIETAANQFSALSMEIRATLGGGNGDLKRITNSIETTVANLNRTLTSVNGLVSDPSIKTTLATVSQRLPQLLTKADRVMEQTESMFATFEGVGQAAEGAIRNVEEFTEPFGQQGDEIVAEVRQTIGNLNSLMADLQGVAATVNRVAVRIENGDGTLAKLIDDDELYYSIADSVQNFETVLRRLQPIVEDARVFSDKLARSPGSIARDALLGSRGGIK